MLIRRINVNVGMSSPWHIGSLSHTLLDCKDMPFYVTKIIPRIHWNDNDTYNFEVNLFIFNNYDTLNDQSVMVPQYEGSFIKYTLLLLFVLLMCSITVPNHTEWHWSHWSFSCLLITDITKFSCYLGHHNNSWSAH